MERRRVEERHRILWPIGALSPGRRSCSAAQVDSVELSARPPTLDAQRREALRTARRRPSESPSPTGADPETLAVAFGMGAIDQLGLPAIMCDQNGEIVEATQQAECLLTEGRVLSERRGRLRALSARSDTNLQTAILETARAGPDVEQASAVVLESADGCRTAVAEVRGLPHGEGSFRRSARVLVVISGLARDRPGDLVAQLGLTATEAEVACALAEGFSPREIAQSRGVSTHTVRSQMKAIFAKLGVRRQSELAARLRPLL